MRTTLTLDDDALEEARRVSRRRRISLGKAVSELVRRGASRPLATSERNGFAVVRLPPDTPTVRAATVDELLDELP
jgi:hypothetical protein